MLKLAIIFFLFVFFGKYPDLFGCRNILTGKLLNLNFSEEAYKTNEPVLYSTEHDVGAWNKIDLESQILNLIITHRIEYATKYFGFNLKDLLRQGMAFYISKSSVRYCNFGSIPTQLEITSSSNFIVNRKRGGQKLLVRFKLMNNDNCFAEGLLETAIVNVKTGQLMDATQDVINMISADGVFTKKDGKNIPTLLGLQDTSLGELISSDRIDFKSTAQVKDTDIDFYSHVNTSRYINLVLRSQALKRFLMSAPHSFDLNSLSVLGHEMSYKIALKKGEFFQIELVRQYKSADVVIGVDFKIRSTKSRVVTEGRVSFGR